MYQQLITNAELEDILERSRAYHTDGRPASYSPGMGLVDTSIAGVSICSGDNRQIHAGSYCFTFTIQSIAKVLALICVLTEYDLDYVSKKVGLEPTGEALNSLLSLELVNGPNLFNPLSKFGAMVVTSLIKGTPEDTMQRLLNLTEKLTGRSKITWDEKVYQLEKSRDYRNKAAVYLLKEQGAIEGDPEEVIDKYFRHRAIRLNSGDLARMACVIGLDGNDPETGKSIIPPGVARNIINMMATYGMYSQSGSFAHNIGLPSESGDSGGIMSVAPPKMGIGVYSAAVDKKGNSVVGLKVLERLSRKFDLNIYKS